MKNIFLLLLLTAAFSVSADQRFESWQGLCHFAYDTADDDNEVYFANCENVIDTYDAGDGQGRLAYGTSKVSVTYNAIDRTFIKTLTRGGTINLKGADASDIIYPDAIYKEAANTPCVMVTSNYNAAADDNNETVYITNDYNLEVAVQDDIESATTEYTDTDGIERKRIDAIVVVDYALSCRGGIAQ